MERKPFERCGVRCSRSPSFSNSATASVERMSLAPLPEYSANSTAISPRTIWASLSPSKFSTGPAAPFGLTEVASHTWLAQPCTLLASLRACFRQRRQRAAKLDQIAVAVVPLLQQIEILDDLVDRHGSSAPASVSMPRYIGWATAAVEEKPAKPAFQALRCRRLARQRHVFACAPAGPARPDRDRSAFSVLCEPGEAGTVRTAAASFWPAEPDLALRHRAGLAAARGMLVDELIDHLGAGLGALADRDRGLRADRAGARLAIAETAHVGNRRARGDHRIGRRRPWPARFAARRRSAATPARWSARMQPAAKRT